MEQSDTPRTDEKRKVALALNWDRICIWEWAEQLERELSEVTRERDELRELLVEKTKVANGYCSALVVAKQDYVALEQEAFKDYGELEAENGGLHIRAEAAERERDELRGRLEVGSPCDNCGYDPRNLSVLATPPEK